MKLLLTHHSIPVSVPGTRDVIVAFNLGLGVALFPIVLAPTARYEPG